MARNADTRTPCDIVNAFPLKANDETAVHPQLASAVGAFGWRAVRGLRAIERDVPRGLVFVFCARPSEPGLELDELPLVNMHTMIDILGTVPSLVGVSVMLCCLPSSIVASEHRERMS